MARQRIPGLSLAVIRNGHLWMQRGYGLADVELGVRATPSTVYQIQSVTKLFTAAAIALLAREKKVDLDDPVGRYLAGVPGSWREITLRHLLTHTSGIKDFVNEPVRGLRDETSPEQIFQEAVQRPLNFPPGERWAYSNTNYLLLGLVLQKVTGLPYSEFLRQRIFSPLGMKATRSVTLRHLIPGRASGYVLRDGALCRGEFTAESVLDCASSGLCSTVEDLARFEVALTRGRIVEPALQRELWSPARLTDGTRCDYGLGWFIVRHRGARLIQHGGGHSTGFAAKYLRFPEQRISVILLCNQHNCDPDRIALGVAGLMRKELLPVSLLPDASDPEPELTARMAKTLAAMAGASDGPQLLTPELRSALTEQTRRFLGAALPQARALRFLGVDRVDGKGVEANGVSVVQLRHYRMTRGKGSRFFTFYLTLDDRVAGLNCWEE